MLVLSNLYPPQHVGGYELRCQSVVDGLRRIGHEVFVLTGRFRGDALGASENDVARVLHVGWGPPYPPEDLTGLLRCEASDRRALANAIAARRPEVVDVWGMEFASQSLVAGLLASGGAAVHVTLEDTWLRDAYARDPLCALTQITDDLGVELPASIRRLCCLGLERPHVGAARVCFVSGALAELYCEAGFRSANAGVRIAGIDPAPFRRIKPAEEPPPFVILSVGQLTASRGHVELIEAAARVAADESCPWPIVVRIVGGGGDDYLGALKGLAERVASDKLRVELVGEVAPPRIAESYENAHLFVFASHLPEGLPRVLMEAMAAGVPIVATNTGGQRDILEAGRWGKLVAARSTETLAGAIRDAVVNLPDWQARARSARHHALEQFDIANYVRGHAQDLIETASGGVAPNEPLDAVAEPTANELDGFGRALGAAAQEYAERMDVGAEPENAWRMGVVLKRALRPDAAEALFARLRDAGANVASQRRATFHLAELAMARGDWSQAVDLLGQCLSVAPDHAKAAFDLRYAERERLPEHLAVLREGARRGAVTLQ